jgi:DNA-binding MarR family transcriptional regulator
MSAGVREAGFDDLQDALLAVFQYPGPDGLRPSDLARQLGMSRQATNHLLAQLETLGYLERISKAGGQRRRVYLTDRGARLQGAIRTSVRRFEVRTERLVGRSRYDSFLDVLRMVSGETE